MGAVFSSLEIRSRRSYRKEYISLVSIVLILQSGLRNWAVGADTYAYYLQYEWEKRLSWSEIIEEVCDYYLGGIGKDPGYLIFQKLAQYVFPHFQLFLIFIATLFFSALAYFIYQNTSKIPDAALAYLLYACLFFSFFSITGLRQTVATVATLFGYELIKRKKLVAFLILILLASSIHKSVLIFLPFYLISQIKKTVPLYWAIFLGFPVLMIFRESVSTFLMNLGGYEEYGIYADAGTHTFTLMFLLFGAVAFWRMRAVLQEDPAARPAYNAFATAMIFVPLTWVNPSGMRVVQYYSIFMLLLGPRIVHSFRRDSEEGRQVVYLCYIVVLVSLFIRSSFGFEYAFFWQDMELGANYY
jgi:transmembrane protein EpsG